MSNDISDIIDKIKNINISNIKPEDMKNKEIKKIIKIKEDTNYWDHILKECKYDNKEDNFKITADQIKNCKKSWKGKKCQFEPRLLCYQSSLSQRPEIFKKENLCILPIKNGEYIVTKNNIFNKLDYSINEKDIIKIDKDKSSLILSIGNSETSLIDNLRYSGIFERDEILGEKITHGPMLNGRHRCSMKLKLGKDTINIEGVQYETDSCFESENKILIIEGKSSNKKICSFNIRQLYFPFRAINEINKGKKEVISLFIHNLNDKIHIWKYSFPEIDRIDKIKLEGHYVFLYKK
jgi:hypothetical protein